MELNHLETLAISTNLITDDGAKSLSKISSLINLDIAENDITDDGMSEILNNLPSLKSLTLTSEAVGNKTVEAILSHPKLENVLIYDHENVESDVLDQIHKYTENNKKKNETNKNSAFELASSGNLSGTANTSFFKTAGEIEDKENIDSIQQELNDVLERAMRVLRKVPNTDQQKKLRKNLIDSLLKLPLLPNSPECKG